MWLLYDNPGYDTLGYIHGGFSFMSFYRKNFGWIMIADNLKCFKCIDREIDNCIIYII